MRKIPDASEKFLKKINENILTSQKNFKREKMRKISDASENSLQKINEINFERVRETLDKDK